MVVQDRGAVMDAGTVVATLLVGFVGGGFIGWVVAKVQNWLAEADYVKKKPGPFIWRV